MKTVICPVAPLYAKADAASTLVDELLYGMTAKVLAEENGFYQVETYYGYPGYIPTDTVIDTPEDYAPESVVTCAFLDVMPEPKYLKHPIITLSRGSHVSIDETVGENNYVGITLADGTKGFCCKWHVKKRYEKDYWKTHEVEIRESLVTTALKYLDTQYRWGGKSAFGVDCSGLCSTVYLQHEMIIFRDAKLKEPMRSITRDKIKPGDLIYFPGHVGMYIGGNRFIHSTQRYSGVCINSFDPYASDYSEKALNDIVGIGTAW